MGKPGGFWTKTSSTSRTFRHYLTQISLVRLIFAKKSSIVLKLLAFPLVSVMLVSILMASPFVPLLGREYCTALILGASEEENNSNETSNGKSFESKFFVFRNFFAVDPSFNQEQNLTSLRYVFQVLEHTIEILDPPPKELV